ncbi:MULTISPECIES: isochorismate synthase [unclassified Serratia (in: enterobacteria)]|uniref:isochorismate synthase n=1 Tax=unclassified Serratia (in: enterobacteria) TaxID=2647522 RepID=UPI00050821BD|nr:MULTISPECIES: isochorismate synthase [unclassified Serratia (in: enterobacteria)]KFK92820.1 isochorismate synthase [Serratia sp. Ag2]KFK94031.1 isochorismate synthase [Serratia sp. Ag1]
MVLAVKGAEQEELQGREQVLQSAMVSPTSGFFFTSPYRSLSTQGCFANITQPAADGDNLQGRFQQGVQQAFAQARQAGISNPLLCGAIPFDTRQPSALFIPRQVQWFEREAFMADLKPVVAALPVITHQSELPEQTQFMQMVADAVQVTSSEQLEKVVLSRLLEIKTGKQIDLAALMMRVMAQNPQSYHFHVPLEEGALVGASPELLLRKYGDRFYSNPLAGSARRENDPQRDRQVSEQLLTSAKDRYEHQIVTAGMRQVLQGRCRRLHIPATPGLLNTNTLWHLSTPIEGEAAEQAENALSLACLLHPTPALCGTPTLAARDLIGQLEPFERGLFGGIVGWCDAEGNGEWVVTIRCGTVNANQVRLFAGAGIVPDSSPQAEWHETSTKLSTMLRAFGLQG